MVDLSGRVALRDVKPATPAYEGRETTRVIVSALNAVRDGRLPEEDAALAAATIPSSRPDKQRQQQQGQDLTFNDLNGPSKLVAKGKTSEPGGRSF